jgi:NhaP-type Na+/H+ or K+/H+ antiporter
MYQNLAILAAFTFLYGILSGGLARTPVNGALVFMGFGAAMGPLGLDLLHLNVDAEGLRTMAELTLALVLFTDAAGSNLRVLQHSYRIPLRLLGIGLPLTIVLGYAAGVLLLDGLGWMEIAILAVMLAPTDAALGKAVVTNPAVPGPIREGLNMESGLNDGICVPILFVFLLLASEAGAGGNTSALALKLVAEAVGIGIGVGVGMTWLAVTLLRAVNTRGWVAESWEQITLPTLAVACFGLTQWLGGSGFIACFVGGLLFGAMEREGTHARLLEAEGVGDTMALLTWVVFGAGVVGQGLDTLTWQVVLYAFLSLTVIRMLPVFLCLAGSPLGSTEKLFVGWFGPRGLASIVFAVIVLEKKLPGGGTLIDAVVATIVLSVLLHGLSANPLVSALASRLKTAGAGRR